MKHQETQITLKKEYIYVINYPTSQFHFCQQFKKVSGRCQGLVYDIVHPFSVAVLNLFHV